MVLRHSHQWAPIMYHSGAVESYVTPSGKSWYSVPVSTSWRSTFLSCCCFLGIFFPAWELWVRRLIGQFEFEELTHSCVCPNVHSGSLATGGAFVVDSRKIRKQKHYRWNMSFSANRWHTRTPISPTNFSLFVWHILVSVRLSVLRFFRAHLDMFD